jgi:hypothetical protein
MSQLEIQDVNGSEWDYLIVLDACRYDYFEKHYDDFLEGNLEKKRSRGTQTPEWLRKTFTSRYNYTYIAANPYVNSLNVPISQAGGGSDWNPTSKFTEIIDAWVEDWSDEHNTVPPEEMTDTAIQEAGDGKSIIHYLQPHRPYISCPIEDDVNQMNEKVMQLSKEGEYEDKKSTKRKIIDAARPVWSKFFWKLPYRTRWKIKDLLGIESPHWGFLVQEVGEQKVKEYYQQDLRMALEEVKRLIKELDGKVIVTADHGEALGEHNDWGHTRDSDNPYMYTVPWLEVEGVKE